jgi:thiol-disulfide isomerase/thioredoxin
MQKLNKKIAVFIVTAILILTSIIFISDKIRAGTMVLIPFEPNSQWLNTQPLLINDLKGKVVLLDFWSQSCGYCIQSMPYVKKLDAKYRNQGLITIGIHTPENQAGSIPKNVALSVKTLGINFPVVMDNSYFLWHSYNNRVWPSQYLFDKNMNIRYHFEGFGDYETLNKKIEELLNEKTSTPKSN